MEDFIFIAPPRRLTKHAPSEGGFVTHFSKKAAKVRHKIPRLPHKPNKKKELLLYKFFAAFSYQVRPPGYGRAEARRKLI